MDEVRHVVLVKPGDILLIGNVGLDADEVHRILPELRDLLGIEVVLFVSDIDMSVVSGGSG